MKIITINDEDISVLTSRADEIVDIRKQGNLVRQTVLSLKGIIREKGLKALSAPAIGIDKRIFVINFNGDLRAFINPIICNADGIELSREECTSIPSKTFIRPRNNSIAVTYQTPLGKIESKKMVGKAAIVFQHEMDHLDGLLLNDVALEIDESFDSATDEEKLAVINAYLDSLDIKQKELEKEIENDEELQQISEAIDFMQSVAKGETIVTPTKIKVTEDESSTEVDSD